MPAPPGQISPASDATASADRTAAAALRELPEALVLVFDEHLRFVLAAGRALERVSSARACRQGQFLAGVFPADVWEPIEPLCRSALAGETRSREIWTAEQRRCLTVDVGPLLANDSNGAGAGANVAGGVAVVLDTTARRRADLLEPRSRDGDPGGTSERAPIGTGLLDNERRWLLANRTLCDITGYTVEELIGKPFERILHPDDIGNDLEQRRLLLEGQIPAFQIEQRYFDAAGETVKAILSTSLVRDRAGTPLHYVTRLQDISERLQLEEHQRDLANHDPLTGLRDHKLFEHDLKLQIARSRRYGEVAGLMIIDLDELGDVNDEYGHKVRDEVLKAVARGLTRRLRETDLVAHLGNDEFAVLLPHIDKEGIAAVAEGLARVIPACGVEVGDDVLHPRASIGFVLVHEQTRSCEQARSEARRAMRPTSARQGRGAELTS